LDTFSGLRLARRVEREESADPGDMVKRKMPSRAAKKPIIVESDSGEESDFEEPVRTRSPRKATTRKPTSSAPKRKPMKDDEPDWRELEAEAYRAAAHANGTVPMDEAAEVALDNAEVSPDDITAAAKLAMPMEE